MRVFVPFVLLRDDAEDIVGFSVRLAATGRQGNAANKLPHLGVHDDPVADPQVEVPGVAEPGYAPAGDADVYEPG